MAFISLLIVCSASWFIKNYTDGLYQWPTRPTDESRQEYIDTIAEDTLSDYFTTGGVYKGHDSKDARQTPTITAKGAQEIYGYVKNAGESDEDFLARIANDVSKDYEVVWEAGVYCNLKDGDKPREIPADQGYDNLRGRVAGSHYYRIVDTATNSVICYKHKVTITQDTLKDPVVNEPSTPLFAYDDITYGATWAGNNNSGRFTFTDVKVNVATFMANENKSFGSSSFVKDVKKLTLNDIGLSATNKELLVNNYSNANDTAIDAIVDYTFLATAYSDENGQNKIYYGTIVQALEATDNIGSDGKVASEASAGTNVVALQTASYSYTYKDADDVEQTKTYTYPHGKKVDGVSYTHVIDKNCVVGANVTLIIPYGVDMSNYFDPTQNKYEFEKTEGKLWSALEKAEASNYIQINAGKTLENRGNLIIPGVVSGGSATHPQNSITTGSHSRIVLGDGAQLKGTSGKITCYGYITEENYRKGSKVEMTGGNIEMIFTIAEHRGGSAFSGLVNITEPSYLRRNMESSPFNRFYVESITTDLVVYEGATATGRGYMVVADYAVNKAIGFFGTSGTDFLQFDTSGADSGRKTKVTFRYDVEKKQNQMTIEGGVKVNPLKLEMAINVVVTATCNMNTTDVYLPLSHYWNIVFARYASEFKYSDTTATVDSRIQDIKIMPGASLTVDEGVTLKAKNIAVYYGDTNIPTLGSFYYHAKTADDISFTYDRTNCETYKYSYTFDDGEFIVNGTVDTTQVEEGGAIGGFVKSTSPTGRIISSANSVISKEPSSDGMLDGQWTSNTLDLQADAYVGAEVQTNQTLTANKWYSSTAYGDGYVWFDPVITITYDLGYDGLKVEKTYTATGDGGIGAFEDFERENFIHTGWFTDSTGGTPVYAKDIRHNMTVYARWKAVPTYPITYNANYPSDIPLEMQDAVFTGGKAAAPAGEFTNVHTTSNWQTDTSVMYNRPYYLVGWSTTPDGEVQSTFDVTESGLTLYAVWEKKVQLTIDYNCGASVGENTVLGYTNETVWVEHGKSYTPNKDVYSGDDDIKNKWYFEKWKDITACTISGSAVTVSSDTSVESASINASWLLKQQLNITQTGTIQSWYVEYNSSQYTTTGNDYWLKPTDTLTISATAQGSMFSGRNVKITIGSSVVEDKAGAGWQKKTITATYTPGSVTGTITNIAISN